MSRRNLSTGTTLSNETSSTISIYKPKLPTGLIDDEEAFASVQASHTKRYEAFCFLYCNPDIRGRTN